MDSPKHCRMGDRVGSLFDSGHNYPGGIKKLYYYNERAEHIFVFCLYRAGAEGEYVAAATCHTDFWASEYINIWIYNRIRVSKGFPGSAAWQMAQKKHCAHLVVRSIPMSLLRRKSCSALASTILESPLHRTKATCTIFFCAICQAALPGRPFDTRILIRQKNGCPFQTSALPSYFIRIFSLPKEESYSLHWKL